MRRILWKLFAFCVGWPLQVLANGLIGLHYILFGQRATMAILHGCVNDILKLEEQKFIEEHKDGRM